MAQHRPSMTGASGAAQALVKDHSADEGGPTINDVYSGVPDQGGASGEKMGSGGTATVYKVVHKVSGQEFACKVVKLGRVKDVAKREMLMREIAIIKMLDHPNIVKIVEVFQKMNVIYIIMELCTGGELFDKLYDQPEAKFTEPNAAFLVSKALGALNYLHSNDIAHRDLKLENFIFDTAEEDAEIKLIDFGFSRQYLEGGDKMHDTVGTCYYLAPEVLGRDYTESSDLWSLGVVVYMMVTGECPFGGQANSEIIANIKKQAKEPAKMQAYFGKRLASMNVSENCTSFLLGLLTVDPAKRLTAAAGLKHPWITDRSVARRRTLGPHTSAKEAQQRGGSIIHQLKHFREQGDLKRAALMAISTSISKDEMHHLMQAFNEIDADHDGCISFEEFAGMMKAQGLNRAEITTAFEAIDQDHTHMIKFSEFIAAAVDEQQYHEEDQLAAAFHKLDLDDSGFISHENLRALLPADLDEATVDRIIKESDFNSDGKIDLAEFKTAMSGHAHSHKSASAGTAQTLNIKKMTNL